jgi:glutamyl-tRNA synthetase
MTIEALNEYMLMQGPSQALTNLEWDSIWNLNKKVIDPVVPRFVALESKNLCVHFRFLPANLFTCS